VSPAEVGAHEYRNHFGWYMERAAAGESFLITRRGRPYARLSPPYEQLLEPTAPPRLEVVN
jgi:prevent-host-death family protein